METDYNKKIKVGITHGDYNGVGYEVILKAFEDPTMFELCVPIVYGSQRIAAHYRKLLDLPQQTSCHIEAASAAKSQSLNFINVVGEEEQILPGQSNEASGRAALAALERAVRDLKEGEIDVLVTAPINKSTIQCPDFHFAGHTEYLEASLGDEGDRALMIMAADNGLRVALATVHTPLAEVAGKLTRESVSQRIADFNTALIRDFGIHAPRIAVLALNPHAGDNGVIGHEEEEIIAPAIADACADKILAFGPYPADGFFGAESYTKFDGVLAMYHDQGLIPFKTLCGGNGVNFTAGLPWVRTSPDHGTACDIAGKGVADAQSMRSAIYLAIDALRNRAVHDEAFADPLKKIYQDRIERNF